MKWQMRKIVLLAVIVSILFFSMLVYYVTYPFLFQNKMFLLSNFCLFQLEKHMKELSLIRIIIAGLLLLTVLIVCKRIWRQFFYSKKLQKVLIPFVRKGKQIYILPTTEVAAYTIGLFRPKGVRSEGMMYIPILKGLLQRYHTYQELAADKYAMRKMESSFELGSALLKLIKIKTMENRCVTASFAKTAINLRIEQVLNEKVVKLTIPLHTNSVYVTVGLFCVSVVLIVGECI